jgi:phage/plasmid-associated DNA primase
MADAHLAEMVATDRLGVAYRWGRGLGWMHWDGRHWADCADEVVIEEVRTYLLDRYREALGELERLKAQVKELERDAANGIAPDAEQLEKLKKSRDKAEELKDAWYSKLSGGRIFTLSRLTRGILLCEATRFDAHPDLLNVANGVVDLRSGELRPHDPDLLLTKLVKVGYVPGARHPDWAKALEALPQDEHAWYQQRLGQAITGYPPPDDRVLIQQGSGENGKTTIMAGIKALLGDYAVLVSERVLLSNPDNHPTELMDLRGDAGSASALRAAAEADSGPALDHRPPHPSGPGHLPDHPRADRLHQLPASRRGDRPRHLAPAHLPTLPTHLPQARRGPERPQRPDRRSRAP